MRVWCNAVMLLHTLFWIIVTRESNIQTESDAYIIREKKIFEHGPHYKIEIQKWKMGA